MRFALLALVLLTSCHSTRRYNGSGGTENFETRCKMSMANCYEEASKQCTQGYDVLYQNETPTFVQNGAQQIPIIKRSLGYKCKPQAVSIQP